MTEICNKLKKESKVLNNKIPGEAAVDSKVQRIRQYDEEIKDQNKNVGNFIIQKLIKTDRKKVEIFFPIKFYLEEIA